LSITLVGEDAARRLRGAEHLHLKSSVDPWDRMIVFPHPRPAHVARNPKRPDRYAGQSPWGTRFAQDGVTIVVDEYEQNVTAVVRHMRASGYKLRQIVELLKELGVVGRTGKPIGTTRVFEIIYGSRKKSRGVAAVP
jgi:hypothetical protein